MTFLDWLLGPPLPPTCYIPDNAPAAAFRQRYNLSCEVGTFKQVLFHYGFDPSEEELLALLGHDENPDRGFRGDVASLRGDLNNYGAHAPALKAVIDRFPRPNVFSAEPIADLDQARQALVRNWLVIAWVPVTLIRSGRVSITTSAGERVTLVPGEHTITLHAYDPEGFYVYDPRSYQRVPNYVRTADLARSMALFDFPGLAVRPLF